MEIIMNIHTCVVYKNMENSEVLELFSRLIGEEYPAYEAGELTDSDLEYERESYCKAVNMLLEMAANYGFSGNLWHTYLTWLLVNSENAFSKSCEIVGAVEGSINVMARHGHGYGCGAQKLRTYQRQQQAVQPSDPRPYLCSEQRAGCYRGCGQFYGITGQFLR